MTPVVGSTTAFTLAEVIQVLGTDASGTPIIIPVAIDIAAINAVSGISGSAITSIGEYAFEDGFALVGVAIPSTVTSIGAGAFAGCTNLQTVIPNSVTSIGAGTFDGCTGATVVFLCPFSVTGGDLGDIPPTNVYYDPAATSPLMVRGKYGFTITARIIFLSILLFSSRRPLDLLLHFWNRPTLLCERYRNSNNAGIQSD